MCQVFFNCYSSKIIIIIIRRFANLIYKSKHGVYMSVVTNRAGQGRANTRPLDLMVARSNRLNGLLKQQWCLSVWAVPGRLFQSLPVPCSDKQGRGRAGQPGQSLRGAGSGAISIKKILGENWGTYI